MCTTVHKLSQTKLLLDKHKKINAKCPLKSNYVNSVVGLNSLFEHPSDA